MNDLNRRTARRRIAALSIAALALAACGGDDDSAASPSGSTADTAATEAAGVPDNGDGGEGGTLTFFTLPDEPSLDAGLMGPIRLVSATRMHAIYDALTLEDPVTGEVVNRLAESFETTDDTTWTLTLRSGIKFSDGTDFDAEAVKAHWTRIADPSTNAPLMNVAQAMTSIEVVDPLTLRITLAERDGQFPRTIATQALTFVPSPTALAAAGPEAFATAPVGAGPFVVSRFVPDDTLELTRNADYYGEVHLDKVIFKVIGDDSQRLATLQTTEHALAQFVESDIGPKLDAAGLEHVQATPNGGQILLFNMDRAPFDDPVARQAVQKAIDVGQLNDTINAGAGEGITTIFREGSPFHDPSIVQEFDAAEAQRLFDEYASEHGGPLRFTLTSVPGYAAVANFVSATLSQYDNVEVVINEVAQSALIEWYLKGSHEAGFLAFAPVDGSGLAAWFATDGPSNFMGYSNPNVDAALETGRSSAPDADRKLAFETVQRELIADVPVVWLWRLSTTHAHADDVHVGKILTQYGTPLLDEVRIDG